MEILILLLLLRFGVCSKFTPRSGGTGRLGPTVALPPFPPGRSPLTRLDVGSGTISPAPCGARAASAEGRGWAGRGSAVTCTVCAGVLTPLARAAAIGP